ncbi:MAG TPA: helix-turn-helix domain-containing protein [Candidatus Binataceae bacterium]|nr:helix-turn-helix domain-containing protein [Candidatus Binataceae bacterium]
MNEIKVEVAGMMNKNGKPGADQFKIVAEQIRAAAEQIKANQVKTGPLKPATDPNGVVLSPTRVEASTPAAATPAMPDSSPSGQGTATDVGAHPPSASAHGTNGATIRANGVPPGGESRAINLVSAVVETADQTKADPPHESARSATSPVIDLATAAAESQFNHRPRGRSKLVIGTSVMLPAEASVARLGEVLPERPAIEATTKGAPAIDQGVESSLGMYLLASREKRAVTRENAARETRIPAHYIRMMESNDYSMVADQLYLLPFLRRYTEYLGLDSEEVAIRFVREVQRAENSPAPNLSNAALDSDGVPSNRWAILGALAVVALVAGWMMLHQRRHAGDDQTADINFQQQNAMQNDDSGPPLPEHAQGSGHSNVREPMSAARSVVSSVPARSQPRAQSAAAPHGGRANSGDDRIPPPGATE